MRLYDKIGGNNYDKSRHADPYISRQLRYYLKPNSNERYLDIGCGTGNYTIALKCLDLNIIGVDQSIQMINIAQRKDSSIAWFLSNAEKLPFLNNSFSGAICILAIHHFDNLQRVFNEVSRVISNGCFVLFTATPDQMKKYWLNEYFPEAMEKSIDIMPSKNKIRETLQRAGFTKINFYLYDIKEDLEDFFLYSGKYHPEMYLDPQVLMNISTFAAIAESDEIKRGCALLEADIRSGRILQLVSSYNIETNGDYLFVIGEK